jgi:hypothetical protein
MFDYNLYLAIAVHSEQAVITFGTCASVSRKGGTWLR